MRREGRIQDDFAVAERRLIADVVNRRMTELKLNNPELARLTNCDRSWISNLRNARANPTLAGLVKIAHALEIRVVDLFQRRTD